MPLQSAGHQRHPYRPRGPPQLWPGEGRGHLGVPTETKGVQAVGSLWHGARAPEGSLLAWGVTLEAPEVGSEAGRARGLSRSGELPEHSLETWQPRLPVFPSLSAKWGC